MSIGVAIAVGTVAAFTILGTVWKFLRGLSRNADAWELVKKQLVPNAGSSLIDRVGKIEARVTNIEEHQGRQDIKLEAIHEQVSP